MIVSIIWSTTEVKGITNFAQLQEKYIFKSYKVPKKIEKIFCKPPLHCCLFPPQSTSQFLEKLKLKRSDPYSYLV
jgi:hypothetical protein